MSAVHTRRFARGVLAVSLTVVVTVFGTTTASAHSQFDDSSPRNGSTITSPPAVIKLRFNEAVSNPRVVVRKVRSTTATGRTTQSSDRTVVTFRPRGPLSRGEYSVTWRVRSADGHYVSGVFRFTVRGGN